MKKLRKFCAAVMLLLAFSLSTLAGDIGTGVVSPPPPPPASVTVAEPEKVSNGEPQGLIEPETLLNEITLSFFLRLLSVF